MVQSAIAGVVQLESIDVPTDEELAETRQDLKIVLRELAKGQKTSAAAE